MTTKGDSLGDRMKRYEDSFRISMPRRMPVIIRVDGKAFHTVTRKMKKPFDQDLTEIMNDVALALLKQIQGAVCVYTQSDEISVLVINYKKLNSEAWFDNNLQKNASVSAAIATGCFNKEAYLRKILLPVPYVTFDSRAFVLPEADVNNYFIWRQQDWIRNSIQMLARSMFSQKQLNGKNVEELKRMCLAERADWVNLPSWERLGRFGTNHPLPSMYSPTPVFKGNDLIQTLMKTEE